MRKLALALLLLAFAATPTFAAPTIAPVMPCDALVSAPLDGVADKPVHLTKAAMVVFNGAQTCEVSGVIEPKIMFYARLPTKAYTGRYLQTGCGGFCGHLPNSASQTFGCFPYEHGEFALAATDMGHEGNSTEFGDDPQLRIDYAYRAQHQTALVAKALIKIFYGVAPTHSYFTGCSDGGREGLIEVERYPEDFDGVALGAAASNMLIQNTFHHEWAAVSNAGPDGKAILTGDDLPILHRAAKAACADIDGVIVDPLHCAFDPAAAQCADGPSVDCLSPEKVEVARKLYEGPKDKDGLALTPGGPLPGSELGWIGIYVPKTGSENRSSPVIADDMVNHLALPIGQSRHGRASITFDRAFYEQILPQHRLYDATNPDIGAFANRGGKLILWHGLEDQHISPIVTIEFAERVKAALGAQADETLRVFLIPGMQHCGGGEGPVSFDALTPLIAWVENGKAPAELVAHGPAGGARVTLPYPAVARYLGAGDKADPKSYSIVTPAEPFKVRHWIGEELFTPGSFAQK